MEIISSSLLIQLLIAVVIALGVVIAWGIYFPQIKLKSKDIFLCDIGK